MDNSQWPWLIVLIGIFVVGGVIAYGRSRTKNRTEAGRAATEAGGRELYREEEQRRPDDP